MSYTRIDPTLKSQWVHALRSGKYPQGQGALLQYTQKDTEMRSAVGYCCLGVACVAVLDGELNATGDEFSAADGRYFDSEGLHFVEGTDYADSYSEYLLGMDEAAAAHLIDMNDNEETPSDFNTIADWIEANL